jgi:hypothetical protein
VIFFPEGREISRREKKKKNFQVQCKNFEREDKKRRINLDRVILPKERKQKKILGRKSLFFAYG